MEHRSYPLGQRTSFRIGGPADRYVEPDSEEGLKAALSRAADEGWRVRALGGGKNLLVDDAGVGGLVIATRRLTGLRFMGPVVRVGAGISLPYLLRRSVGRGFAGLEGLAGVPGSVGGAVRMNAGGAHGTIGERVLEMRGFEPRGEEFRFTREACGFTYRGSRLAGLFVTEVTLGLDAAPDGLSERVDLILAAKRATQPLTALTAGCVFKNPDLPGGESAGWLLDHAGVKVLSRGGAAFSEIHANFIVNRGDATCADVEWLIGEGRRRVAERYGVDLDLEVEVWKREDEEALLVA